MGAHFTLRYRRTMAWIGVGIFLDWSMTIVAVGFMGARELNPLFAPYFHSGNYLVPLLVKLLGLALFALGYYEHESICAQNPDIWWVRHIYRWVAVASLTVVWFPVAWNTAQNLKYLLWL
jgi:hypothetical protein